MTASAERRLSIYLFIYLFYFGARAKYVNPVMLFNQLQIEKQ